MAGTDWIYLDNAATTRTDPEVLEAMRPFFCEHYGNAATLYQAGNAASKAVEKAREQVAELLGALPEEVFFTSGGTESDNWAFSGSVCGEMCGRGHKHIITSAVEHHAVLETVSFMERHLGCPATFLPVDAYGAVSPDALREALRPETALVSVMHANNEIGTVQPVAELAALARQKGALFHTDAVQSVGKIPVNVRELGVDMLSLSAHKFHGPKGVGAMYIRKGVRLSPFMHGGAQERKRRAGTSNVPGIVGLGKAAELAGRHLETECKRQAALVEKLWEGLNDRIPKIRRNGHPANRVPNLLNLCVSGIEGEAILLQLDMYGIAISSGSACTTGSLEPSHVLLAIGLPAEVAHGSARFSLSRETTERDIERVIEVMPKVAANLRAMSPIWHG